MQEKIFSARMDTFTKVLTGIITVLMLGVMGWLFSQQAASGFSLPVGMAVFLAVVFGVSYAFRPVGYFVGPASYGVLRPLGRVVFPLSEVEKVEQTSLEVLRWSIRTFGVGGFFGYFGKFANKKYGNMTWYATRRSHGVVVVQKEGAKLLFTPDDVPAFLAAMQHAAG